MTEREQALNDAAERLLDTSSANPGIPRDDAIKAASVNPAQAPEVFKRAVDWGWLSVKDDKVWPLGTDADDAEMQVNIWAEQVGQFVEERYGIRRAVMSPTESGIPARIIRAELHIPAGWWARVRQRGDATEAFLGHGRAKGVRYYPPRARDEIPTLGLDEVEEPKLTGTGRTRGSSAETKARQEQLIELVQEMFAANSGEVLDRGVKRADLNERLGLTVGQWNATIAAVLERGEVVKIGERRGTRYYPASAKDDVEAAVASGAKPTPQRSAPAKPRAKKAKPAAAASSSGRAARTGDDAVQRAAAFVNERFAATANVPGGIGARGTSRKDVQSALALTDGQWQRVSKVLLERRLATKAGVKRSTRYFPAGTEVSTEDLAAARAAQPTTPRTRAAPKRAAKATKGQKALAAAMSGPTTVDISDPRLQRLIEQAQATGVASSAEDAVHRALNVWLEQLQG